MLFIMGGAGFFSALAAFWPKSAVWQWIGAQMRHVEWHGFAHHDMIFPTFLFIAGCAFPYSLAKQRSRGRSDAAIFGKIVLRGLVLVLLGILYNNAVSFHFAEMRYASVLGHIGLAWMIAALISMKSGVKTQLIALAAILVGYWLLLRFVPAPDAPAGADRYSMEGSIVGWVDRMFLPGRLHKVIHDPEGLLSLVPAVGTALLGVLTGEFLRWKKSGFSEHLRVVLMLGAAAVLILLGRLWNIDFPINKNLWTSSFVCFVGGLSLAALAVFYWVIDVLGWKGWAFFFVVIGMNSITIYLAQRVIGFEKAQDFFFKNIAALTPEPWSGVILSGGYIFLCWIFLYFLYRHKIFLKV